MSNDKSLDDNIDSFLKEENAQNTAVNSLVKSNDIDSPIEMKTDLTEEDIVIHSVGATINKTLNELYGKGKQKCILGDLIEIKERKLISKNRQSRNEIVQVARNPDTTNIMGTSDNNTQGLKGFFKPAGFSCGVTTTSAA